MDHNQQQPINWQQGVTQKRIDERAGGRDQEDKRIAELQAQACLTEGERAELDILLRRRYPYGPRRHDARPLRASPVPRVLRAPLQVGMAAPWVSSCANSNRAPARARWKNSASGRVGRRCAITTATRRRKLRSASQEEGVF